MLIKLFDVDLKTPLLSIGFPLITIFSKESPAALALLDNDSNSLAIEEALDCTLL